MPITLGILAQSRQAAAAATFQLLESTVLTSAQSSIEFTNLTTKYAATYEHLQLRVVARGDRTATFDAVDLRLNGDSGTYDSHFLSGNGSSVTSGREAANKIRYIVQTPAASNDANAFGVGVIDILDAFNTSKNTTVRSLTGRAISSNPAVGLFSGLWVNTASVTSIALLQSFSGNFVTGTRVSLYGIRSVA